MADELVVDAPVAAKAFFFEDGSEAARDLLTSGRFLSAPDLIFIEMASVASKYVRRGLASEDRARDAVAALAEIIDFAAPARELSLRAFSLASEHGFSVYDGTYLALAEARGVQLVTADQKLLRRAETAGLAGLVRGLLQ